MLLKKIKNNLLILLSVFLLLVGIILITTEKEEKKVTENNKTKVEHYIQETMNNKISSSLSKNKIKNDYIAVLEIPTIKLKRGLVSLDNIDNDVEHNIQMITSSSMPDKEKGNLILAAHSGNSEISFFKKLYKLKLRDTINVYYKGIKYIYSLDNYYDIEKNGYAEIVRNRNKTTLTLITCKRDTNMQTVYISYLIDKQKY